MKTMVKRAFDVVVSAGLLVLTAPIQAVVALLVKMTSRGPVLYRSMRVGQNSELFEMWKFRTMLVDAPEVATHLLEDRESLLTPIGHGLRVTSLDELPQLWHVLAGQMSIVGPRPALHNQHDLVSLRKESGVDELLPGVTGLAQVSGRDDLSIEDKVEWDADYRDHQSFRLDLQILLRTVLKVVSRDNVTG